MQQFISKISLPIVIIIGSILFSSYFLPSKNTLPDETISYKSKNKQSIKNDYLSLSSALQNDYYTNTIGEGYYYLEVKGTDFFENTADRPPLNISLVIDRSGSMSGDKIRNAKKAAKYVVDMLDRNDYVSVIMYDSEVDIVLPSSLATNKELIKNKIDAISERGGTNLCGGMMEGYNQAKKTYKNKYINRVLLMSDGLANEGITDPSQIKNIIQGKIRNENIALSTFGVGTDYNEDLMTAMAEKGAGNYYFINDANDIASIFQKELQGIMAVVAQNMMLNITIPNGVQIENVQGYSYTQHNNVLQIPLHSLFKNETKGILIQYFIPQNSISNEKVFNSKLNYQLPNQDNKSMTLNIENKQVYTSDVSMFKNYYNEWVDAQIVLQQSNKNLEMAMQEIDKGDYEKGKKNGKRKSNLY